MLQFDSALIAAGLPDFLWIVLIATFFGIGKIVELLNEEGPEPQTWTST